MILSPQPSTLPMAVSTVIAASATTFDQRSGRGIATSLRSANPARFSIRGHQFNDSGASAYGRLRSGLAHYSLGL